MNATCMHACKLGAFLELAVDQNTVFTLLFSAPFISLAQVNTQTGLVSNHLTTVFFGL